MDPEAIPGHRDDEDDRRNWIRLSDVRLGTDVRLHAFVNAYGCAIGDGTSIGTFVEIQRGARIGRNCKISSHTFICEGVTIEDECFIGHGVLFINDRHPSAVNEDGTRKGDGDWSLERTVVRRRANVGSGAVIMCGVEVGEGATIGAGAVVLEDVEPHTTVVGIPARLPRGRGESGSR